jgi:transposase-like protein
MPAESPHVPLPRSWPAHTRSAFVQALGLARMAVLVVRGWAANSSLERARLQGDNERLQTEVALLWRELEIKDARMARIDPARRPHYAPSERLAILTLAAARGWTMAAAARRFLVTATTIAAWQHRCDEEGPDALLEITAPVNRFPDFVAALVQELKAAIPSLWRRKIAEVLARAGLHLSAATAKRLIQRKLTRDGGPPEPNTKGNASKTTSRTVVARYPGHVWGADLTIMPLGGGLRVPWLPLFLPLCWPFCW